MRRWQSRAGQPGPRTRRPRQVAGRRHWSSAPVIIISSDEPRAPDSPVQDNAQALRRRVDCRPAPSAQGPWTCWSGPLVPSRDSASLASVGGSQTRRSSGQYAHAATSTCCSDAQPITQCLISGASIARAHMSHRIWMRRPQGGRPRLLSSRFRTHTATSSIFSQKHTAIALVVALCALLVAAAAISISGRSSASSRGSSTSFPCTWQMSAAKCSAVTHASLSHSTPSPQPSAARPAASSAPRTIPCGQGFFSTDQRARLTRDFGLLTCFRFPHQSRWILVGNGMSLTSATRQSTPGGSLVAIERCAHGDARCLDPESTHSFGAFVVARPPDSMTEPLELEAVFDRTVLLIADPYCGLFTFDIGTLHWYQGTASEIKDIVQHPSSLKPLSTSAVMSGKEVLRTPSRSVTTSSVCS